MVKIFAGTGEKMYICGWSKHKQLAMIADKIENAYISWTDYKMWLYG